MAAEVRRFVKVLCTLMILYSTEVPVHGEKQPVVNTVSVLNVTLITKSNNEYFRKLLLELKGNNFFPGMAVRSTSNPQKKGTECVSVNDSGAESSTFSLVWLTQTAARMTAIYPAENESIVYLCVKTVHSVALNSENITFGGEVTNWVHQGEDVVLRTASPPDEHLLSR
jgi:hypothetical protein